MGANVNAVDEDGHTALMHAAFAMKADIGELLLKNGADAGINDDDCWAALNFWSWAYISGAASQWAGGKVAKLLNNAAKANK